MIAMADETRNIIYVNKPWMELTGKAIGDLLGFGWTDLVHPEDKDNLLSVYLSSFKKRQPFSVEFRILNDENNYRWLMCNGFPRTTFENKFVGCIISCVDMTNVKMEEQRKDDFISIASHELKTPLTSLRATLQLLDRVKEKADAKTISKLIMQANKSMDKVTNLVNDLLGYSKTAGGNLPLEKSVFKISELIDKCCSHIKVEGKYHIVLSGDKELRVFADENRIEQVIVNLVNNSVKYAPGSKKIYIGIEQVENEAKVTVRDTGPGIPEDKIARLFGRYYRANQTGESISGLGLGLFINSEIIKRHNGRIGVESKVGEGSTFWFTLPLL
jgi:PAS domain S-box-containing protein